VHLTLLGRLEFLTLHRSRLRQIARLDAKIFPMSVGVLELPPNRVHARPVAHGLQAQALQRFAKMPATSPRTRDCWGCMTICC
jgi:hypothetical protein